MPVCLTAHILKRLNKFSTVCILVPYIRNDFATRRYAVYAVVYLLFF